MGKVLLLILVVLVVAAVFWAGRRRVTQQRDPAQRLQSIEPCAHCGVHVPAADAVVRDGKAYCSDAHRDLGPPQA